ncbi:MAG: hypothetical protein Q9190_007154, partial [Brigantiaea leucoxantha]
NGWSTTSNIRIPPPRWEGKDSMALGTSQKLSGVPYNPNLTQSQNGTRPLQKDSFDSFGAPKLGLKGTNADEEITSLPSEHAVTSWDNMILLSCNPIEVDSGHESSDDSGTDSGHEASSATTSTCAISPGVSNSNEGQIKNTVTSGKEAGGLVAAALNPQEQRDSS